MKKKKWITSSKRGTVAPYIKIVGIISLIFLVGTGIGAIGACFASEESKSQIILAMDAMVEGSLEESYFIVFLKYAKYTLLIWVGGWFSYGIFISVGVFIFRSISLGYTSAMIMGINGIKGIFLVCSSFLIPNIFLIPAYILMMCASLYYGARWNETQGRRGLKREKRKKQTEYFILLVISIILVGVGSGIEFLMNIVNV